MTVEGNIEFLFDSRGAVVAFRHGRDVFDLDLGWLGWAPWNDGDVFDPAGRYLGTITPEGRLYEIQVRRGLTSPPPQTPTIGSHPGPPRGCAPERLAAGMRDVRPRQVVRPHELPDPVAADEIGGSSGGLGASVDHDADGVIGLPPLEPQTHPRQAPRGGGRSRVGRPG